MTVHAYCIVPAHREPPHGLAGCGGAAVAAVAAGDDLACWLSAAPAGAADAAAVRAHNQVVAAAMDTDVTPVPLRFGQRFPDPAAAASAIAADAARWRALLDRFAGHAEYGVRVASPGAARDVQRERPQTGRAYMASLAARQAVDGELRAEAQRVAARVQERVARFVADSATEALPAGGGLVTVAHLVAWIDAGPYREAVARACDGIPELHFLFTGPWPPYSFVA